MKSDVIAVSSREDQIDLVLEQAEQVAAYQKLSARGALHLRLLSEEVMSMMRAIAGDVRGEYWIENKGERYELHLKVRTNVDPRMREQLLGASKSGKNEASRGFMGKIRAFFEPVEGMPLLLDPNPDGMYSDMAWTMSAYQQQIRRNVEQEREGAAEAWDELEKSLVAHLADDVKVSIRGRDVEMTVYKKLI